MSSKQLANKIVNQMFESDAFSKWLGIEIIEVGEGFCELKMTVREEMTNGFKIAHGGITYSLADSALAFASNSHGRKSVSVETSISHTKQCFVGDVITAKAKEKSISNKIAVYETAITNQKDETVALFKGTVYRTSKDWF
ncbi:MAG: phenylacetic acid degradation protein PaaD [Flavobacteriales bacterium]|nr:MAG: phenylacetic acid degradation protein PaaD [Flavobacteriales bacterium]